jgi:endonuclease/exonuclease/phosphatase family metal-dependent hydrolase
MPPSLLRPLLLLFALGAHGATPSPAPAPAVQPLKLATWNLEWLMEPETLRALRPTCFGRNDTPAPGVRAIPCDVANELERSGEDFAALARHARALDADVVALQEVDGIGAARRVFPDYEFCFSARETSVQNLGFAIRRGVKFKCGADLVALALDDTVRRGVELVLNADTSSEMRLLAVHLKSGCARDTLDSPREACTRLAQQVPVLEAWIADQVRAKRAFALLGDFNRDLNREPGPPRTADGKLVSLSGALAESKAGIFPLVNTSSGSEFRNCMPSQTFSGYIDYVLLGNAAASWLVPGTFGRELFPSADAERRKLSDHCPVYVRLNIPVATKRQTH